MDSRAEIKRCRFCGHAIVTYVDEYLGYPPDGRIYFDGASAEMQQIFHCPNCNDHIMYSLLDEF